MRTFLSAVLLSGAALLAGGAAPAAVEAQRTGSAARGAPGTATMWVGDASRLDVRPRAPGRGWLADPWGRRADWRAEYRFGYPDLRYGRPDRRTRYGYAPYYAPVGYYSPLVVYAPPATTHQVYMQTEMVRPRTIVLAPAAAAAPALEACAVVTVLQPDHRGYWKELQLPAAGAHNADELQRIIDARIEEGVPFTVRDADGETIDIPSGAALDRVVVDGCR